MHLLAFSYLKSVFFIIFAVLDLFYILFLITWHHPLKKNDKNALNRALYSRCYYVTNVITSVIALSLLK